MQLIKATWDYTKVHSNIATEQEQRQEYTVSANKEFLGKQTTPAIVHVQLITKRSY